MKKIQLFIARLEKNKLPFPDQYVWRKNFDYIKKQNDLTNTNIYLYLEWKLKRNNFVESVYYIGLKARILVDVDRFLLTDMGCIATPAA